MATVGAKIVFQQPFNGIAATGTSFASPVVAALAGRYGSINTRAIEREAYIRNSLQFTGKYDGASSSNLPINLVHYTPSSFHEIPEKLIPADVFTAFDTANRYRLIDSEFYDNIIGNSGAYGASIIVDLGSAKNVSGVRVMMRSSAAGGALNFAVHGGNAVSITSPGVAAMASNPTAYWNATDQYDLVPYYIPINGSYRYIMLEASNAASWVAYSEVEVYGK